MGRHLLQGAQVLRTNRSGRLLPGILKVLWALKRETIRRARIMLLGVLPEYRGKGIDAVLWHWVWSRAGKHNMTWGEASRPMTEARERTIGRCRSRCGSQLRITLSMA